MGVDWSGAKNAHRKIWAARVVCQGNSGIVECLQRPFPDRLTRPFGKSTIASIVDDFGPWLMTQDFDVAGLDFCFGLAAEHMRRLELPLTGPSAVGIALARYGSPEEFKDRAGREIVRETDRERRSPFRPTNLRMYRQTYWGLRALAKVTCCIPPWSAQLRKSTRRAVVEVLPSDVARKIGVPAKVTGDDRRRAVTALERHGITIAPRHQNVIISDRQGDALDAVFAAIAAASARASGFRSTGGVQAAASGEGWIYSI